MEVTLEGVLSGTTAVAGGMSCSKVMAGYGVIRADVVGTESVIKPLADTLAWQSSAVATVDLRHTLTGQASAAVDGTGTLSKSVSFAGAGSVGTTTDAALAAALRSTITAESSISGGLSVTKPLAGALANHTDYVGALTRTAVIGAQATVSAVVSGTVVDADVVQLEGALQVGVSTAGDVKVLRPFVAAASVQASMAGECSLTVPLASTGLATADASADTVNMTVFLTAAGTVYSAVRGGIRVTDTPIYPLDR